MAVNFKKEVPSNLHMNNILSKMNDGLGPARSARFVVSISTCTAIANYSATLRDLVYLCETAEFPGRTFMNSDIRYYGPSVKFPFQTVYEDVNFTFLCRIESKERELFDVWQDYINPINTFDFSYKSDYATDVDIFQLDEQQKAKYLISMKQAYPIMVNPQPVTWADDNFQRLAVTFTYARWEMGFTREEDR